MTPHYTVPIAYPNVYTSMRCGPPAESETTPAGQLSDEEGKRVMGFICRICGWKSPEKDRDYCGYSPTKVHNYLPESPQGYLCQHCGYSSYTCEPGDCAHSPAKKHVYIAKKSFSYICKYCGWEPTNIAAGSCGMSPHGNHEFM